MKPHSALQMHLLTYNC